ncbi:MULTISPECIES: CheR family methyltransferase [unclassified Aureimonas]|uniref:CheR family methyltransferase n=1 Tax=unclassified Aureimonas TaxID=2615206 RepID=UPI0006FD6ACB|nr:MULTISPECIES: protein-glutamate O-methyltransferase [unclassified Aureimonas]KQT53910.1 chemotaxis protein [Aureimonas sp. Leaf427]KQT71649.1 chemotaxis protein [Aureimonas sp. Leaf460]
MSRLDADRRDPEGRTGSGEFLLTDADFTMIARILHEDSGILLAPSKSNLVYSRLAKRLRTLGLSSFKEYCAFIAGNEGASERMSMLAALTTNVTHFFRENHHFEHLKSDLLPPHLADAKRGGRVRIWSAGCSNGHEPYSIALSVLSMMPEAANHDVRILATDIDPNVVAFGRAGVYDEATLEAVPKPLRQRWFKPVPGDAYEVSDAMRDLVSFRELNLIGDWPMQGTFQAIFCRNVTIYFDQPTREKIWHRFCRYLEPGGWFYMGHSERLTGPATEFLSFEGTTAYRRLDGVVK